MSIQFSCPNGHLLRVKESLAGRKGLCPACKVPIQVPQMAHATEDEVLEILGPHYPDHSDFSFEPAVEADQSKRPTPPPYKSCSRCHREILSVTHICPFCHTYVAELADF
jgi:hypothetical protein